MPRPMGTKLITDRIIPLLSLSIFLSGCFEEEKRIRDWMELNAKTYFETVIRNDSSARFAKTFADNYKNIEHELNDTSNTIDQITKDIATDSKLEEKSDLNETKRAYFSSFHKWVDIGPRLTSVLLNLKEITGRLNHLEHLCEDKNIARSIPYTDVGGVMAAMGGEAFTFYLAATASYGPGVNGVSPAYSSMGGNFIQKFGEALSNFIGGLFSSKEDRDALERAKQLAIEKQPQENERTAISQETCKNLNANSSATPFLEHAHVLETRTLYLFNFLASRSTSLYKRVVQIALASRETSLKEVDQVFQVLWAQFQDDKAALAAIKSAEDLLVQYELEKGDCSSAQAKLSVINDKIRFLNVLASTPSKTSRAQNFVEREKFTVSQLIEERDRLKQRCGIAI